MSDNTIKPKTTNAGTLRLLADEIDSGENIPDYILIRANPGGSVTYLFRTMNNNFGMVGAMEDLKREILKR